MTAGRRDHALFASGENSGASCAAVCSAFAFTFLPLLFTERGITVALFFTPFAVSLLFVRLVGLKYLQHCRCG